MTVRMIISGGQTGADRGGFDAAIVLGLQRGGMAPKGWRAEDGVIPEHYRIGMTESTSADYTVRTRANVDASDGTLVLTFEEKLTGGSLLTLSLCRRRDKPVIALDTRNFDGHAVAWAREFLTGYKICTLNIAGPRESKCPGIQVAVRDALVAVLKESA